MTTQGTNKLAPGAHTARFNAAAAAPQVSIAPSVPPKVMSPTPGGTSGPALPAGYRQSAARAAFAEQRAKHNAVAVKPAVPTPPSAPRTVKPVFNASAQKTTSPLPSKGRSR